MVTTPTSLLARLREPGQEGDWERFVALYTPLLYAWARRLNVPRQEAGDLLQDLFTCLLQELPTFTYDPRRSFRAWMHTLLVNRWRTWLRRRAVRKIAPGGEERLAEIAGPDTAPEFEEDEYRRHLVVRAL